jgi:hypothetical protein
LRVQLTIRNRDRASQQEQPDVRFRFFKLKSALALFLSLAVFTGIFIAALVIGSVIAMIIIGVLIVALLFSLVSLFLRTIANRRN